jgi:hypothetical protein
VLKHYGALFLLPRSRLTGRPDLIGYAFVAGETPAYGLQEASSHLADNFPTFGPVSHSRPACSQHDVLWFADVAQIRRHGAAYFRDQTAILACLHCAGTGEPLTMLNQGIVNER